MLTTNLPDIVRQGNPEEAVSVIHAPESFASWVGIAHRKLILLKVTWLNISQASSEPSAKSITSTERSSPKGDGASQASSTGTFNSVSPTSTNIYEQFNAEANKILVIKPPSHPTRPPISTDVKPVRYSLDSATPRAQDLQDMLVDGSRLRSSSTSSLESQCLAYSSTPPTTPMLTNCRN